METSHSENLVLPEFESDDGGIYNILEEDGCGGCIVMLFILVLIIAAAIYAGYRMLF